MTRPAMDASLRHMIHSSTGDSSVSREVLAGDMINMKAIEQRQGVSNSWDRWRIMDMFE